MEGDNASGGSRDKVTLEQQYMLLLEQRVAQLEKALHQQSLVEPGKPTSANGEILKATETADVVPTADKDGDGTQTDSKKEAHEEQDATAGAADDTADEASKQKTDSTPEPDKRVQSLIGSYDRYGDEFKEIAKVNDHEDANNKTEASTQAAVFRQVSDDLTSKKIVREEVDILSMELKRLYREITKGPSSKEAQDLDAAKIELTSPFINFVWYWNEFEDACAPQDADSEARATAREDLKELMSAMRRSKLEDVLKARETATSKQTIKYEYLWTLFRPGDRVYVKTVLDDIQMFEVSTCTGPPTVDGDNRYTCKEPFTVSCVGFDWDGSRFVTIESLVAIPKSKNRDESQGLEIDKQVVYPTTYHRGAGVLPDLIERGRKFWKMCDDRATSRQYNYSGPILTSQSSQTDLPPVPTQPSKDDETMSTISGNEDGPPPPSRRECHGKIIVDALFFLNYQEELFYDEGEFPLGDRQTSLYREHDCECKACIVSPVVLWQRQFKASTSLRSRYEAFKEDEQRVAMLPPRALGYALKTKAWAQFMVKSCKQKSDEDSESENFFKTQLQLDEQYKKMLMAFVMNHQSTLTPSTATRYEQAKIPKSLDVIEGKGKGLAVLLHGPPGVGKFLTAETIALASGRPLLTVSVAEIGTKAAEAEGRLTYWFAIAARWGALLLVDEADVFLEERISTDNPERNMLVSVLLRCLEYYEGIIFLTTNRIRSIDVAVQSRMHLAVQYKRLTQKQKAAIYKNLLDKVPAPYIKSRSDMDRKIADELCRRNEMNGRQIRNIVSAALALAAEKSGMRDPDSDADFKLTFSDLRRVHETTVDFLDSLKDTTKTARQRNEAAEDGDDD